MKHLTKKLKYSIELEVPYDIADLSDEEQACSEENSSIKTPESMQKWESNIRSSMEYFKEKFGVYPFGNDGVQDTDEKSVLTFLKNVRGS